MSDSGKEHAERMKAGRARVQAAQERVDALMAEPSDEVKAIANFIYECVRWAQHGANEGMISTKETLEPGDRTITHQDSTVTVVDQDPSEFLFKFWEDTGRFVEFEETAQVVKDMILKRLR